MSSLQLCLRAALQTGKEVVKEYGEEKANKNVQQYSKS